MEKPTRVIFRKEYDPYKKEWGFLACFPDDESRNGYIQALPFYPYQHGGWERQCYSELSLEYYYSKKIIHKGTEMAQECLNILRDFIPNEKFKVCERR